MKNQPTLTLIARLQDLARQQQALAAEQQEITKELVLREGATLLDRAERWIEAQQEMTPDPAMLAMYNREMDRNGFTLSCGCPVTGGCNGAHNHPSPRFHAQANAQADVTTSSETLSGPPVAFKESC